MLHIGAEVLRIDTNVHVDFEGDIARPINLYIVPRHAIALDVVANCSGEVRVDRQSAESIDGDKHGMPAAGPAKCRNGALHAEIALGYCGIVGFCDRPLLCTKRSRRVGAHLRDRLWIGSPASSQRISNGAYGRANLGIGSKQMGNRFSADISGGSIADAIRRKECGACLRRRSKPLVSKAQPSCPVVFDFRDEMMVPRAALEQITHWHPIGFVEVQLTVKAHRW